MPIMDPALLSGPSYQNACCVRQASAARADQSVGEAARDVESGLLGDLDESRRTGDIDLGEIVADDVEADHQHAFRPEPRSDRLRDLAIARRDRARYASTARG